MEVTFLCVYLCYNIKSNEMKNTITTDDKIKYYFDQWMEQVHITEGVSKERSELAHVLSLIVDNTEIKLPKELNDRALTILGR